MNKKKVYNIILNSLHTDSYTGPKEDATYSIDLNSIMDSNSLKSSYLIKFRIKSLNMSPLLYDPATNLVVLRVRVASALHNMLHLYQTNIVGVLSFVWEKAPTATTSSFSCDTPMDYNPPVYVDNLCSVNSLYLNFYDVNARGYFSNMADYVCIVSFEEQ